MKYLLAFAACCACVAAPAHAQWFGSIGTGFQHAELKEYAPDGRELVREHGWLPVLEAHAERSWQAWQFGARASTSRGGITYDGRVQGGAPFTTDTDAVRDRLGIDATYQLSTPADAALIGGIEWEHRDRRIRGRDTVAGLDERSTAWHLLAGGGMRLATLDMATINAKSLLVFARAERLHVGFDRQTFDDADFSTKPAIGLRAAMTAVPTSLPHLAATLEFEWMRVRRSAEAPLTKNGMQQGTVTQPEHRRRTLTASISYRFD